MAWAGRARGRRQQGDIALQQTYRRRHAGAAASHVSLPPLSYHTVYRPLLLPKTAVAPGTVYGHRKQWRYILTGGVARARGKTDM